MTDKEKIIAEIERRKNALGSSDEAMSVHEELNEILSFINSLPEEPTLVYVVTRSEEHADYAEAVFADKQAAEEYCKPFNDDVDSYHRDITELKITY